MKKCIYSTAFNIKGKGFNHEDALDNWFYYADEVSISVNKSEDDTLDSIHNYAKSKGYRNRLLLEETDFDYNDPYFYGKLENSALQRCDGNILIQQNLDERFGGDKKILDDIYNNFLDTEYSALFIPVINLYGSYEDFLDFGQKWYIHKSGCFRGPVDFGIKNNGLPDYNKTSTDELIDEYGKLVPTIPFIFSFFKGTVELNNENYLKYCSSGLPFVYHLGYVDLNERVGRNKFWKTFWEKATGGDENTHSLDYNTLEEKCRSPHNLSLWEKI